MEIRQLSSSPSGPIQAILGARTHCMLSSLSVKPSLHSITVFGLADCLYDSPYGLADCLYGSPYDLNGCLSDHLYDRAGCQFGFLFGRDDFQYDCLFDPGVGQPVRARLPRHGKIFGLIGH